MTSRMAHSSLQVLGACVLLSACTDLPSRPLQPAEVRLDAVKFWEVTASTRWNERAIDLFGRRTLANGQAAASRILTYLSIAQYRAVLAAEDGKNGSRHPSVSAAVGGASVAVLKDFFSQDANELEAQLDADLAAEDWPGAQHQDEASGEAIGRAVAAEVLAQKATDNYLVASAGTPLVGPGYWIPAPGISRSLHGSRPFFMTSADQVRPGPPPQYGSPEFLAALAEVRAIADSRTPEQIAIAQRWNTGFTAATMNLVIDDLIRSHHRKEREATRILAYANAAAFDAQIACSDAKFTYWFIRPTQADPGITLAPNVALPNHPSYPSAHSCITSALMTVAADAFPSERGRLEAIIAEAGLSRMYGGLHYRFDVEAGQDIGRATAALALAGSLR